MALKVSAHTKLYYFSIFTLMMLIAFRFFVHTHWIVAPIIYVFTLPLWIWWMCGSAFDYNPGHRFYSHAHPILYYRQQAPDPNSEEMVRYVRGLQAVLQPPTETVKPVNVANDVLQNADEICHCDRQSSVENDITNNETKSEKQGLSSSGGEKMGLAVDKDVLVGSSENLNVNDKQLQKLSLDKVPLEFLYNLEH